MLSEMNSENILSDFDMTWLQQLDRLILQSRKHFKTEKTLSDMNPWRSKVSQLNYNFLSYYCMEDSLRSTQIIAKNYILEINS